MPARMRNNTGVLTGAQTAMQRPRFCSAGWHKSCLLVAGQSEEPGVLLPTQAVTGRVDRSPQGTQTVVLVRKLLG